MNVLPILALGFITACGHQQEAPASMNDNVNTISEAKADSVALNEEAILRRSARADYVASCFRQGNAETWASLSMTTDQIRWVEQLQGRVNMRNDNATASVNKDAGAPVLYTFDDGERRRLAQILTDDQMERWIEQCPGHPEEVKTE